MQINYLNRILSKYLEAFSDKYSNDYYTSTSLQEISEKIKFTYYHHSPKTTEKSIQPSSVLESEDPRFTLTYLKNSENKFPSDARFFRGCIQIGKN